MTRRGSQLHAAHAKLKERFFTAGKSAAVLGCIFFPLKHRGFSYFYNNENKCPFDRLKAAVSVKNRYVIHYPALSEAAMLLLTQVFLNFNC